ncbi:phage holin [Lactobacillus paragasseri]|uniref:phage holin n=1 Tax=Bacillota TaxID=1239 RepID=UPI001BCCD31B|nr:MULTISPECIES: phage holin [Bacillota]MBS7523017.1 holin [Lactobacillus gasseri]MDU1066691.1 phage holin [Negativicoccus succinicivorans]MDX5116612.1 phage holin [Lactobacillus paragasseri]MDX5138948.1 phage holin [Lactobacillus paragasseri]MDX5143596.1 phage holin [Lactobacillus paragasseri]
MSFSHILDLVLVVTSVTAVIVVSVYAKHKIAIDKKVAQGDLLAKAEKIVAQSVSPLVYQAEKRGGEGEDKLTFVVQGLFLLLDMAHLPHPTMSFVKGMVEKAVTAMKQTQSIADTVDKPKTTIVGELKEVKK